MCAARVYCISDLGLQIEVSFDENGQYLGLWVYNLTDGQPMLVEELDEEPF